MLSLTGKQFMEIRNRYPDALDGDSAFDFVHDILNAEADAIKEKFPYATKTISRLEDAAYQVFEIGSDISCGDFEV